MAVAPRLSAKTLFNDPVLSDVKITQICNGKRREYFAHKAVLCSQSSYFMKAFTGNFKEAMDPTMDLHEDDPDHFEFMLKFMYTLNFDVTAVKSAVSKGRKDQTIMYVLGVYKVADKYDVSRLLAPTAAHLQKVLDTIKETAMLELVVKKHYDSCPSPGRVAGSIIASTIIGSCRQFVRTPEFPALLALFPIFAADIALCYHKEGLFNICRIKCGCGTKILVPDLSETDCYRHDMFCHNCKSRNAYDNNRWE